MADRQTRHVRASSVTRALNAIGDRWTLLLLRESFFGVRRFEEWRRRLGIARSLLANRLRRLVAAGLLEKLAYSDSPPRFEYPLTPMGRGLYPVALMFWRWELRWGRRLPRSTPSLVHLRCGRRTHPCCVCERCGVEIDARDSRHQAGPGAGREPRAPARLQRRSIVTSAAAGRTGPFDQVVDLLGDRWTNLVLYTTFFGLRRFDAMRRELAIATNILSDRLRRLVDARVLERIPCGERSGADYVLTERGRDLFSVVVTMMRWGDEWLAGAEGPPLVLHHRRCGRRLAAKVVCDKCRIELRPAEVRYRTTTA